jgi:arylsulfatase A-like enzyme/Flp pilus assembly protein TadD
MPSLPVRSLPAAAPSRISPPLLLLLPLVLAACGGHERENVLFVTIDTLRADRVGVYGCPDARTPHLDRLARGGTLFTAARVPYSMTLPSHASIFTGQWPYVHRARRNDTFDFDSSLPALPGVLDEAGWRTGAIVASFALNAKFGLGDYFQTYDDLSTQEDARTGRNERPAREVTDRALAWLAAGDGAASGGGRAGDARAPGTTRAGAPIEPDAPWFLWAHYFDPHDDYDPPGPWPAVFEAGEGDSLRLYDGEIAEADRQLGRLFRAVAERDDADRTLRLVVGDHGEAFGEHGETGHGYFLYDNSILVPLILGPGFGGAPGGLRPGDVRSVDLFPTVVRRVGADLPPDLPGRPLDLDRPAADDDERVLYAETFWPSLSYGATDLRVIVRGDWKYVHAPREELYDLAADPGETDNLALVEDDVLRELRRRLDVHLEAEAAIGADPTSSRGVDEETRERLLGLGYLGGGSAEEQAASWSRRDPKDIVELLPLLFEGIRQCRAEQWEDGVPLLEKVLAEDPINPKALHWVSRDRSRRGDKEGARQLYLDALEHDPANAGLLNTIGQMYLRDGLIEDAIPMLELSTEIDPREVAPFLNLVPAYAMSQRMDDARRAAQAAIDLDPENPIARDYAQRLGLELPAAHGFR